jgi:hypothetical protein
MAALERIIRKLFLFSILNKFYKHNCKFKRLLS